MDDFGESKARGLNLDRKSGVNLLRRFVEPCNTFQQLLQLR
jgi:hypothetical protein